MHYVLTKKNDKPETWTLQQVTLVISILCNNLQNNLLIGVETFDNFPHNDT